MRYFDRYISKIDSVDIETALVESHNHLIKVIVPLKENELEFKYEEGKWSIKDILQHLIDTERIFTYRATRFARNDKTELPGYDENLFAQEAKGDRKSKDQLINEYIAVHKSSIMFFNQLSNEELNRIGVASGESLSVKDIGYIISGHILHHIEIVEERYLSKIYI